MSDKVEKFQIPDRFLGVNTIVVKPATIEVLVQKPLNYVNVTSKRFRALDLPRNRWQPYHVRINGVDNVMLLSEQMANNIEAIDYLVTMFQRYVCLTTISDKENGKNYHIEIDDSIKLNRCNGRPNLVEESTFCDILDSVLNYDKTKVRSIRALVMSFNRRFHLSVEDLLIARFPELWPTVSQQLKVPEKEAAKDKPKRRHGRKKPAQAPVQETALSLAFADAREKAEA